ncbi:MAG TPA: carboxypeptidase-like regulatory domain-containing protein, partial [Candidatus Norongarragalinales archaeon]|nr:carboxypeptidase-like regulatory domain-containing protein [Candidatus Norongarragalinales archaeon]
MTRFVRPLPLKAKNDRTPEEIALEKATEQNSGKIRVSVLNQENLQPISGAKIFLYNSSYPGAVANNPYSLTNNDGNVLLEGLSAGTYRIEAEKDDFNGVAENIAVSLGQTTNVRILAIIGNGSVKAVVTDWETGSPVENASVSFYNALSEQQELLAQKATGGNGEAANSFRSDAVVYLKAEKEGYISAITTRIDVIQNQETRSEIRLMSQSIDQNAGIIATLEGLFEDGQATRRAHSLEPNHYYFAKFAVALPQNKPYSNLISHVRAGPDSAQTLP